MKQASRMTRVVKKTRLQNLEEFIEMRALRARNRAVSFPHGVFHPL
jgi:hypothetical protein